MEMVVLRILGIDTSGKIASVALTDDDKLVCEKTLYTNLTHSQIIMPMVDEVMQNSGVTFDDIDAIAVANGPGSYTGLRIGIAAVKGICLGSSHIKCAGVSTLEALAYNCSAFSGRIVSVMKARPNVIYAGEFQSDGTTVSRISDDRVCAEDDFFASLDKSCKVMLVGDYAATAKDKYFCDNCNVICAGKNMLLQRASSLCLALEQNPEYITEAAELEVAYLQATKAEKDKAHSEL